MSPVQGTCGLLQFIWAKPLFQIALISGDTNKTAAVVLLHVDPLLKKGHRLWMISNYMGGGARKRLITHGQGNENPVSVIDYNQPMGRVDLKDQPHQLHLLEGKKMTMVLQNG